MTGMPEVIDLNIGALNERKVAVSSEGLTPHKLIAGVLFVLCAALLVSSVVYGIRYLQQPDVLPIRKVTISGDFSYLQRDVVAAQLQPFAGGGFFSLDVAKLVDTAVAMPWVKTAEVRRKWPDGLDLVLREHKPFAYWGMSKIISDEGVIFAPLGDLPKADWPHLAGPSTQSAKVTEMYHYTQALLAPMGLELESLKLDERRSWSAQLKGGIHLELGRDNAVERLIRFAKVHAVLAKDWSRIESVDMRYTNGFAIGWKAATES